MVSSQARSKVGESAYLSPFSLARVAGLPITTLESLRSDRLDDLVESALESERRATNLAGGLSDLLHEAIGAADRKSARRRLLALRRDVFNLRPSASGEDVRAEGALDAATASALVAFNAALADRARCLSEIEAAYAGEVESVRLGLRQVIRDEDFRNALLLSSRTLSSETHRWLSGARRSAKQEAKLERGLLRYVSRMAAKTTPFAAFCAVVPSEVGPQGDAPTAHSLRGAPGRKTTRARLNKRLYAMLRDHFREVPELRGHLLVTRNPSIAADGTSIQFLTHQDGLEVFQQIEASAAVALVLQLLPPGSAPRYSSLVQAIVLSESVDATEEEAGAFVMGLDHLGLIRIDTGVSQQAVDWVAPLLELLGSAEGSRLDSCRALLRQLTVVAAEYCSSDVVARESLLNDARTRLDEALESSVHRVHPILYEDATADATYQLNADPSAAPFSKVIEYLSTLLPIAWPRGEQAAMRHFFDTFYPVGSRVPLLQFYEDFFREHQREHLDRKRRLQVDPRDPDVAGYDVGNPFALEITAAIRSGYASIERLILQRWKESPHAESISVSREDLRDALADVPPSTSGTCRSISTFAQFVPASRSHPTPRLVIPGGNAIGGFGKFFSRFLHVLPNSFREGVLDENRGLTQARLAEIASDSDFNANLHEPLLSWEIAYPTGEPGPGQRQLRCSEISVSADDEDPHSLALLEMSTGVRVLPVDLGFMNPRMRPALYQLLLEFSPTAGIGLKMPDRIPVEPVGGSSAGVGDHEPAGKSDRAGPSAYRPRIEYEGCIVLARRRWCVPAEDVPSREASESGGSYLLRLNRWRAERGIPKCVFIRVEGAHGPARRRGPSPDEVPPNAQEVGDPGSARPPGPTPAKPRDPTGRRPPDWHKPQYIDFASPPFVELFRTCVAHQVTRRSYIVMEERLPDSEHLPEAGGKRYATELILQFNWPAPAGVVGGDDGT